MTSATLVLPAPGGGPFIALQNANRSFRELTPSEINQVGGATIEDVFNWASNTVTNLATATGVGAALGGTLTYIGNVWMGTSTAASIAAAETVAWAGGAVGFSAAAGYAVGTAIYNYTPVGIWAVDSIEYAVNLWDSAWNYVQSSIQSTINGWVTNWYNSYWGS